MIQEKIFSKRRLITLAVAIILAGLLIWGLGYLRNPFYFNKSLDYYGWPIAYYAQVFYHSPVQLPYYFYLIVLDYLFWMVLLYSIISEITKAVVRKKSKK